MKHKDEVLFSYGHCEAVQMIWNSLSQPPFWKVPEVEQIKFLPCLLDIAVVQLRTK